MTTELWRVGAYVIGLMIIALVITVIDEKRMK